MMFDLTGKNALVCGSSKGIGKASAIALAKLGANVTLVSRSTQNLKSAISELPREKPQDHGFLVADFSNDADLSKKVKVLAASKIIHILVNNTGGPPVKPLIDCKVSELEQAFHDHLICNHLLTTILVPGMKKSGYGRIINITSVAVKEPIPGLGLSNTVRAAVANWAKTLAGELGSFGITVNNILPGYTATERLESILKTNSEKTGTTVEELKSKIIKDIPANRIGLPEEIGSAVAFLATHEAAYINGINFTVDGGRTKSL
jgi:3-oxoacyl-[acyl-carrier protein] reductase